MKVLTEKTKRWKLDSLDKEILVLLGRNCRISNSEIGKEIGRSREVVAYRIKRMEQEKVIMGYIAGINLKKLGYFTVHLFLRVKSFTGRKEKQTLKYLKELPFTNAVLVHFGSWDLEVSIVAKSIPEAYEYVNEIVDHLDTLDYEVLVRVNTFRYGAFPERFFSAKEKRIKKEKQGDIKLTKEDYKILREIANDARAPISSIAKRSGLPVETVRYRLNRMWEYNIITDYRVVINYNALGFNVAVILLKLKDHDKAAKKALKIAMSDKHVLWGAEGLGNWDAMLYVIAGHEEYLHEVVGKIRDKMGDALLEYSTMMAIKEMKYTYFTENMIQNEGR